MRIGDSRRPDAELGARIDPPRPRPFRKLSRRAIKVSDTTVGNEVPAKSQLRVIFFLISFTSRRIAPNSTSIGGECGSLRRKPAPYVILENYEPDTMYQIEV